jgi:sugar phosphate isomerase/epimerase
MKLGLQLYTVRDLIAQDFQGTLRQVASLGFAGVEFAGDYGGLTDSELKAFLDDLNLETAGLHVSLESLETGLDAQVQKALALNAPYLVCPWLGAARYSSGWDGAIGSLKAIHDKLQGTGVGLAYHNHTFEFQTRAGDIYALDAIAGAGIDLEFDGAWGYAAGVDPAAYLRQHGGRVALLHLKDLKRLKPGTDTADWETVELGQGEVPLLGVVNAARETGVAWALVEQDHCPGNALDSVRKSIEWWRTQIA